MENINVNEMIREQFTKLPPKLQEAITSTEVSEKLREISQRYRLHLDQGQVLENETYMVLLGIEDAEKYEENIKKELGVSPEEARKIADDAAKEIFLSVRNLLKESTTPQQKTEINEPPATENVPSQPSASGYSSISPSAGNQNKLEHIVRNQHKKIEVSPTKHYATDPYREPIE